MKKMTVTLLASLISFGVFADEHYTQDGTRFTTTDESPAAQLCIAALESREAVKLKAKELKVTRREQKQVICNDKSLVEFAKTHREDIREWAIATVQ